MDIALRRFWFYTALCIVPIFTMLAFYRGEWGLQLSPKLQLLQDAALAVTGRGIAPANSTLGFGAVVAVSHAKSSRQKDLLHAANLTGILVTIPEQPQWTEEHLARFRSPTDSRISKGSALAWLGHLNALQWFLSTPFETALILEDDVDWDIRLRTAQIPLAASAVRQMLPNTSTQSTYWGPSDWEILYLGHCGDAVDAPQLKTLLHQPYSDNSIPSRDRLDSKTATMLANLGIPESARLVHRSYFPLCTFGYAVTRQSAQRILDTYGTEGEGGCQAFDVRVLEACRDHGWACYTVTPELFHHIDAPSEIANVDKGLSADEKEKSQNEASRRLQGTRNIGCRARQQTLFSKDGGVQGWLRRMVGMNGQCLMDQMEEDMARWP